MARTIIATNKEVWVGYDAHGARLYDIEGNLKKHWYLPYHFDIGGGDSDLTWRANAGIGYRFDWGDILLTYSYMYYDKGDSGLVKDLDIYGPQLGVVFHF